MNEAILVASNHFLTQHFILPSCIDCFLFAVNPGAKERLVQITGANEESIK